jgi:hypothetical protein
MSPTDENDNIPPEPPFPIAIARCCANAFSYLLRENEGIICQGEDEDGKMAVYLIYKKKELIRFIKNDDRFNFDDVGKMFWMHNDEVESIVAATLDGTECR